MNEWPDPEKLEDEHTHPMGWFQILLYVALAGAVIVGIWFLAK